MKLSSVLKRPYRNLEKQLGYRFRNRKHLETALTHRSYRFETSDSGTDNQRLEFLGDAVLGLLAAEYLYERYPQHQEGALTQLRSRLTNTQTLFRVGQQWELVCHLRLGKGEAKSQFTRRTTTIPDAVEAVLGAVYLDGGLKAARKLFLRWFAPALEEQTDDFWTDNPKGGLQELVQKKWRTNPVYRLIKVEGPAHDRTFTCQVDIHGQPFGTGTASSKRQAESLAAVEALKKLTNYVVAPVGKQHNADSQ